jgi:DNA polymerase III epsilon subunit-like protein
MHPAHRQEEAGPSSNKLDSVSAHFGIELDHHNALSDSLACAKIMMNFMK